MKTFKIILSIILVFKLMIEIENNANSANPQFSTIVLFVTGIIFCNFQFAKNIFKQIV